MISMSARLPRLFGLVALPALAVFLSSPSPCCSEEGTKSTSTTPKGKTIDLKSVKYKQLGEAIRAHKGKIVVVDLWATWCVPCVKEFPHLVALHRTYAADGVVCISVSLDKKEDAKKALAFLQKQKAAFPNYLLDEDPDRAFDLFEMKSIPVAFVFNREGKRVAKFTNDDPDDQFTYETHVVPLVRKLLAAKKP